MDRVKFFTLDHEFMDMIIKFRLPAFLLNIKARVTLAAFGLLHVKGTNLVYMHKWLKWSVHILFPKIALESSCFNWWIFRLWLQIQLLELPGVEVHNYKVASPQIVSSWSPQILFPAPTVLCWTHGAWNVNTPDCLLLKQPIPRVILTLPSAPMVVWWTPGAWNVNPLTSDATHTPSPHLTTVGADGSVMDTQDMERGPPDFRRNPYPESSPHYRRRRQ
jgi:hypothetical protein